MAAVQRTQTNQMSQTMIRTRLSALGRNPAQKARVRKAKRKRVAKVKGSRRVQAAVGGQLLQLMSASQVPGQREEGLIRMPVHHKGS
ncbi:hypothetical protein COCOBI_18-2400 [Coccomyxa sp. Obi]|nr:hypothetical protein COCOBI_18-2400 [Coccomyxa sp. Obi]